MATQNLLGRQQDWPDRRPALVTGLRKLDPDIVLFQEAIVTDDYDQPTDLLGDEYEIVHHKIREPDGSGISIASRWPFGPARGIDLQVNERTADFPASALVVDVRWPDREVPLLVVNHKPSWPTPVEYEREVQATTTARAVEEIVERTGQHVLLGGDFDAMPDAASIRFWRGLQSLHGVSVAYRDVWELTHGAEPGPTFSITECPVIAAEWQTELDRRIDYLFVRCGRRGPTMTVQHCARTFDEPVDGAWGSDHFGLVADLEPLDVAISG
ncbi:MAG TPA: endonuclease/exonuclease/phosphatase family protein [Actinophytocola sp.]|uniref:endonuclease/exonuclease/phosphatase family protein n=1 Tax=Actinophytocola sp. TaxID=1872138 RepID=UPI002F939F6A